MKKPLIIIAVIIAVGAVAGLAIWLSNRSSEDKTGSTKTNTNTTTANLNLPTPSVTYETYTNQGPFYTFDTVKEWTSVVPAEIQKSITEEQRHGYAIIYYSSNPDAVALAVSEKKSSELSSMPAITTDDESVAKTNPNITIVDERIGQTDARTEMKIVAGDSQYTVYSRYLIISSANTETRWALMEVTTPTSRTSQYGAVVSHLLDSLKLVSSNTINAQ
jgi:hypothetical protein